MATETDDGLQRSPWLFLLGVVLFLGSTVLFLFDLVEGNNVARGLAANGVAAVILLGLAGLETLSNPESHVQTRFEAFRAVVFFCGLYLFGAGLAVLAAALASYPDPRVGAAYVAVGGVIVTVTFLTGGAEEGVLSRLITAAGLLGLVLALGSVILFAYDLATGRNALRGIVINGVGTAVFILWTAYDTPSDPDSDVDTATDAIGIALLLYGSYLFVAGIVIVATGLVAHDQGLVGFLYLGLSFVPVVLGFLFAPLGSLIESTTPEPSEESETDGGSPEESETDGGSPEESKTDGED
ncbi:MAG: hypothetical protein J07HX64_02029 [halophilic archaeon J07HX64]|jgi:hypothetical protein|nr:MAG: hypothetical protein J07HX64_02029 [halophilic archaeon J07HX64]